jgi:hypothetical protein
MCTSVVGLRAEIKGAVMDAGEKGIQWIALAYGTVASLIIGSADFRTIADNSFCTRVRLNSIEQVIIKYHHAQQGRTSH